MDRQEEKQYWLTLIQDLQKHGLTLARIADAVGVSERQVAAYKAGERPRGTKAIDLYKLHLVNGLKLSKPEAPFIVKEEVQA